jgi:hypothetical protein
MAYFESPITYGYTGLYRHYSGLPQYITLTLVQSSTFENIALSINWIYVPEKKMAYITINLTEDIYELEITNNVKSTKGISHTI